MKKNCAVLFVLFVILSFCSAQEEIIGAGLDFPVLRYKVEDTSEKINLEGVGLNFNALLLSEKTNFCVPVIFSVGVVDLFSNVTYGGARLDLASGFGYAFVRQDDFVLAFSGILGIGVDYLFKERRYSSNNVKYTEKYTAEVFTFSVGGDLQGIYRFTKNLGFYLGFRLQKMIYGSLDGKREVSGNKTKYKENFSFGTTECIPRVGVVFNF